MAENRNYKSACVNIFSELLLTETFQHYLRINSTIMEKIFEANYSSQRNWTLRESYIFQQFSVSINKILIFGGRLGTRF